MWHTKDINVVFSELNTSPNGLSTEDASKRLAEYGHNELAEGDLRS
jgi:Ca2+-transporting ATPase